MLLRVGGVARAPTATHARASGGGEKNVSLSLPPALSTTHTHFGGTNRDR